MLNFVTLFEREYVLSLVAKRYKHDLVQLRNEETIYYSMTKYPYSRLNLNKTHVHTIFRDTLFGPNKGLDGRVVCRQTT